MNPDELPLRDIHLPDPIGWWPPAPGWWIVAVLILIAIGAAAIWSRRRAAWRRSAVYLAQGELDTLQKAWVEHGDAHRLAADLSIWLRRVSMSVRTRQQAASLTGAQWWRYLDELAGVGVFGPDGGKLIAEAPYRAAANIDADQLLSLCQRWLSALGKTRQVQPQ